MTGDAATPSEPPAWTPTGATRLVALLGDPVAHSLSPRLHTAAFRATGRDLVYVALRVDEPMLADALAVLAGAGAVGANITVPHKAAAHALCDVLSEEAQLVGGVNTVWFEDGLLHGTTTDATGLARALRQQLSWPLDGRRACVLGTGGAARAAMVALADLGARVTVVGRRPDAAAEMAQLCEQAGGQATSVDLADDPATAAAVEAADLVCNATTLGMRGEALPGPFQTLRADQVAYDLVYGGEPTPFVAAARAAGADAHDGVGMLVAQAEDSWRHWFGRRPPDGLLAAALDGR